MMLDRTFDKIKNIHSLYELRLPVLFFGFAVWVVMPILGIFPLLLSIQLYLISPGSKKAKFFSLTNILLLLVVLTVSLYASSINVFADTRNYLDVYKTIDTKGIFDNEYVRDRFEFVPFAFLYLLHILTDGSEYWCLLLFSFSINSTVAFLISKKISEQYYPTLLIIIFSTFFYYSHVFYMRQFLSIVLMLIAIAYLESSWLIFIFWSFLAFFSHFSTALYIAICIVSKLFFSLKKRIKIKYDKNNRILLYVFLAFLFSILLFVGIQIYSNPKAIYGYVSTILDLLPQKTLSTSIQDRVNVYDGRDAELFAFTIFRAVAMACIGIFVVAKGYKKLTPKLLALDFIYLLSIFQIAFILVTGFNQRIAFFFLAFYGFLFHIGLNQTDKLKPFGIISSLTMFTAAANTFNFLTIQVTMIDSTGWSFFDGQPLSMSLFDYILYFFQSI